MAKRVHQLAKELGVKSVAIVTKCQDEGLDVKNHMSTLSAGLAATICEWFSEGEHTGTVETTARVDLQKVKEPVKRKRKAKAAKPEKEPDEAKPAADEPTETSPDKAAPSKDKKKAKTTKSKPKRVGPKDGVAVASADRDDEAVEKQATTPEQTEEAPSVSEQDAKGGSTDKKDKAASSAKSKKKPKTVAVTKRSKSIDDIKPPAPYVPTPAQLQGPKVVRVEHADVVPAPPPKRVAKRSPIKPAAPSLANADMSETTQRGGGGKRGKRSRSIDTDNKEAGKASPRKVKRGAGHRGRGGGSGGGVSLQRGGRDWEERKERLMQASASKLHGKERLLAQQEQDGTTSKALYHHKIDKATVKEPVTVKELSAAIGIRANDIIGKLMAMDVMATINQSLNAEAAMSVAMEFNVELTVEAEEPLLALLAKEFEEELPEDQLLSRPPIVAFLGHVDHGKTSLLDCIRKSTVTAGEAGGITQHIGSYLYDDGQRRVTFLDTPGHKAFTAMRARGANMTDIVVLVVAADDGVMPQTKEAISHAKAAGVSIVIALNKIDLPNADENRVLGQLAENDLVPTTWGGETEIVRTSATTGEGIDDLVEHLDYIAELKQLKAPATGSATGWIIEAEMNSQTGVQARMLVKQGVIRIGDVVVSGSSYGRIRTMADATGLSLTEAGPASPIAITGLDRVPIAGDEFFVVGDISRAKEAAEDQRMRMRERSLAKRRQITLENLFSEITAGELNELNVIIKADVQGSLDVVTNLVMEMNTDEVAVRVLHAAVGGISESDVLLAEASGAIIIGFQVVADEWARILAEREGVQIRHYRVIYQISDDIRAALEGMLTPEIEQKELGRAEVRQIFKVSRIGTIAGCYVIDGNIGRSASVRLIRDSVVIHDNMKIESLRRNKDDASEVRSGLECGIRLANFNDVKVGDVIEAFKLVEIARKLEPAK